MSKVASLNIVRHKISFLLSKMADYNPRKIDSEAKSGLDYSIENYGYLENIIYNSRTETIVSGHQRITILNEQGFKEVDVHEIDVSVEVEKEINVTMNNTKIQGEFTLMLEDLIAEIQEVNPEVYDLTNMSMLKVNEILDEVVEEEKETPTADIPEMELMPYEHYDCVLVVFKRTDDFLYLKSKLGLNEKKVISAPMVKKKKIGYVRAVSADKIIKELKGSEKELDIDNL